MADTPLSSIAPTPGRTPGRTPGHGDATNSQAKAMVYTCGGTEIVSTVFSEHCSHTVSFANVYNGFYFQNAIKRMRLEHVTQSDVGNVGAG